MADMVGAPGSVAMSPSLHRWGCRGVQCLKFDGDAGFVLFHAAASSVESNSRSVLFLIEDSHVIHAEDLNRDRTETADSRACDLLDQRFAPV